MILQKNLQEGKQRMYHSTRKVCSRRALVPLQMTSVGRDTRVVKT